jgi:DNA-binding XRE family transcriptional regulator
MGGIRDRGSIETRLFLQVRKRLGFTQVQMGNLLSITSRQYGRIERGECRVPKKTWLLFCMFALMMIPGTTLNIPQDGDDEPDWLR